MAARGVVVIDILLPRAPATGVTKRCREYSAIGSVSGTRGRHLPRRFRAGVPDEHHEWSQPVAAGKCAEVWVAGCWCHAGRAGSSAKRRSCLSIHALAYCANGRSRYTATRRAEVAEWQTRRSQKPLGGNAHVGSTPTFGTKSESERRVHTINSWCPLVACYREARPRA